MKPITVYCAFCHRPKAGQKLRGDPAHSGLIETCVRTPVFVWRENHWYSDGTQGMECDTWWQR